MGTCLKGYFQETYSLIGVVGTRYVSVMPGIGDILLCTKSMTLSCVLASNQIARSQDPKQFMV